VSEVFGPVGYPADEARSFGNQDFSSNSERVRNSRVDLDRIYSNLWIEGGLFLPTSASFGNSRNPQTIIPNLVAHNVHPESPAVHNSLSRPHLCRNSNEAASSRFPVRPRKSASIPPSTWQQSPATSTRTATRQPPDHHPDSPIHTSESQIRGRVS